MNTRSHKTLWFGIGIGLASPVLVVAVWLAVAREVAVVEHVEPLELKGKAHPVPAFRLLHLRAVPEWQYDTLFVGRQREVALVLEGWERVRAGRRCDLLTIVGDAGVGKSRLAAEVLN